MLLSIISPRLRVPSWRYTPKVNWPVSGLMRADDVDRILDEVDGAIAEREVDAAGMLATKTPLSHVLQLQVRVSPPERKIGRVGADVRDKDGGVWLGDRQARALIRLTPGTSDPHQMSFDQL